MSRAWKQVPVPLRMQRAQRRGELEADLRIYQRAAEDGHLSVMVGRQRDRTWHLSISHRLNLTDPFTGGPIPGRLPTWEEIHEARYLFVPDEAYMAIILPPKREYVNLHETTMHLHEVPPA